MLERVKNSDFYLVIGLKIYIGITYAYANIKMLDRVQTMNFI